MSIRYTKGYTQSDCGPVAALNILKWAGMNVTYKGHIAHLKNECGFVNDSEFAGVRWWEIRDALIRIGKGKLSVRTHYVKRIETLAGHVSRNGAFVLRYRTAPRSEDNPPGHYHYSAVVPHAGGEKFLWLNHWQEYPQVEATPHEFEKEIMKKQQFGDVPIALLVRKI